MREIKFRNWNDRTHQMMEVIYINFRTGKSLCLGMLDGGKREFLLDNKNLMQFTGLKDKNGTEITEIYEGDILAFKEKVFYLFDGGEWITNHCVVGFKSGEFTAENITSTSDKKGLNEGASTGLRGRNYKKIGNIHENPELLEVAG